jgi:cytochrome c-type biogenesis protein
MFDINYVFVFLEGLLSFLSPCVIPLIPMYMSYLTGNAKHVGEDGRITYRRGTVFLHTVFFVMGISFAFFLLGMTVTALGSFFNKNQLLFTRIGGILIIVLGLYQIGFLDFNFLKKERKIRFNIGKHSMNPLVAFVMGFTFSFAWTPCVGPTLSSVLIMASGAKSAWISNLLVLLYAIGFIIPFLLLGLFTTQVLNFIKSKQKFLKYTVKISGALLIIIGIMTFTGWMNGVSKYLNSVSKPLGFQQEQQIEEETVPDDTVPDDDISDDTVNDEPIEKEQSKSIPEDNEKDVYPAMDFTLKDQYGNEHTLSDYKDKVVFLNFWATWCSYCIKEMPDIEKIYAEYGQNQEDVIILGVANPSSDEYPNNADESKEDIIDFLDSNGFTFPVVFDETGDVFRGYFINAFPTTFLIDKEGNIYGYAPGMLPKHTMDRVIQDTLGSTE